jgi:phosphoenolpyruvate synthase/pyruvate phosphate dikinase
VTLLTLDEVAELPVERVGGKAKGLARLAALGLPVPPARVLDAQAHSDYARAGQLSASVRSALAEVAQELPAPLAVRSSATDEDVEDKSAAGQYESVMGVTGPAALEAAVEHCYRAAESERARAYRGGGEAAVALVVQQEARAQRAGVAFSADPVTGSGDTIVVEAAFGHGEGVVSGAVTPDRYRLNRADGSVQTRIADKRVWSDGREGLHELPPERRLTRVLRDDELARVAELVEVAEQGFGAPVDIEFCWSGSDVWLVQCRPITTLSAAHG